VRKQACIAPRFAAGKAATTAAYLIPDSKRIVTKFFQDFLYFTEVPMRNIAALSST
jgi:hypothetical protein